MVYGMVRRRRRVARDHVSGAIVNFRVIRSGLVGGGGSVRKWEDSWLWWHWIY